MIDHFADDKLLTVGVELLRFRIDRKISIDLSRRCSLDRLFTDLGHIFEFQHI